MRIDEEGVVLQLMRECVTQMVGHLKETGAKEYEWLFIFAGWLKGRFRVGEEIDPEELDYWIRFFAEAVRRELSPGSDRLNWQDLEAVELAFDKAWTQRRFAFDTDYMEKAMDEAYENPLQLPRSMNSWVSRVINLAYCLQEHQPDLPFILPVNDFLAKNLGTSIRTLSQALGKAIELGYVEVVEEATVNRGHRKARRLRFNYRKLESSNV